jgi:hypothetical protein
MSGEIKKLKLIFFIDSWSFRLEEVDAALLHSKPPSAVYIMTKTNSMLSPSWEANSCSANQ